MRRSLLALALFSLSLPATAAQATGGGALPPENQTISAAKAAKRACDARVYKAGARGVSRRTWRAPMSGYVTTRLAAKRRDWDLAVFDARSRSLLAASQGFSSREVAQTWVTSGQRLIVQGCRQKGRARRAQTSVQLFDIAPPAPNAKPQLLEVATRGEGDLYRLETLGVDVTHQIHDGKADVIVTGAKQRDLLSKAGFEFDVEIADLEQHFAASRRADLAFARRVKGRSSLPSGRTSYRSLADYQAELKALATQNPDLVKPVTLPKRTLEGRPIEGVELASNVRGPEDGRPVYFVVAVHHAREWPAGEAAMELAHMLVQEYGTNPRVTNVLDKTRVVVVPLINVDGFVSSRGATDPADTVWYGDNDDIRFLGPQLYLGEQATGTAAYRRKTCRGALPVGAPCALQYGVDPNRNYAEGWGAIGASTQPHDQTYRGSGPWSEPETQAVHEYSQKRQVTNIITIHNVAALVLRPPGREANGLAPDEARLKELGDAMARTTGYRSQYGWELYDTSGTTEDWNYAAQGAFGYTIEIGPGDDPDPETGTPENYDPDSAFHMPYEKGFVRQWNGWLEKHGGLKDALLIAGESAANPADHSVIEGTAPAGRVLRAKKEFVTKTSDVCTVLTGGTPVYFTSGALNEPTEKGFCLAPTDPIEIQDGLETTMVVPSSGTFEWHVNPSTRPFERHKVVAADPPTAVGEPTSYKPQAGEQAKPYAAEEDHFLFPEDYDFVRDIVAEETGQQLPERPALPPGSYSDPQPQHQYERTFTVTDATVNQLEVSLTWGKRVEDYDLYVYKNGTLVGSSGNPPGLFEEAIVDDAGPGEYTIRIVNYAAVTEPDWTLNVEQFHVPAPQTVEQKEYWTVTCESPDGSTVYETHQVFVDRGQRVPLNMTCGATKKDKKPKPPRNPRG